MQKVIDKGILRHETTNWLKRTGWSAHFTGRNLVDIYACSKMPGRGNEGNDEVLRHMNKALDRLFFDRCIGGLKSMPLMTRLLLASPHPHDAHSRPFGPLQEKTSIDRYLGYIKRFLCYCLNVLSLEEEVLLADHGFRFTPAQRASLETLWAHLQGAASESEPESESESESESEGEVEGGRPSNSRRSHDSLNNDEGLQERILQVLAGFWTQRLPRDPFDSPLWHFVGVLGIDGETGQLRPAHLFTYMLAGLVFTGRALLGEFEEFLLLLAHITGGQPSRGEEITGLRLINGINRDRNIFIIDGEVVLVTQYHKSLAHFDLPKVIPCFLPGRIGQLFVIYIIYIRPLIDRWEADKWELYGEKMAPLSDFIWHNKAAGGAPWESSQISAAMGSKKHARDRGASRADFEDGEDNHDESEQYEAGMIGANEKEKPKQKQNEKEEEEDDVIIRALRAVLRNDNARFRSPQQEEAVRQAAAQQSPLVAVLPTGGGKSLVFMVPAMLASAGVTIVVAPYAELKRQLVQRCVDAGLDCKPWPEARSSWPRVTLVSAEAAITDDFLQWAADLSVNGRLDRVVIDECHLTFTAAETYRSKLRGLVLLRSLGCPFVFLTGTLPPLRQRDFEEAMQLQNPLYIRASSHRLNVRYAVLRVRNGRGVMEVKRRVAARLPDLSAGEKGIIYCTSQAKCKALALQLGCHYYHALRDNSDSQFIAQREEGFQAWLRGEAPYIVATAALGTGIDVAGITHVIHLEAPFSIIDYAQEAGRAGRTGEPVTAEIIVEDKDWPDEDAAGEACLDMSVREVRRLIRTPGCRRRLLGQCLDGDPRDCKDLGGDGKAKVTRCDNCHRDELAWKSELSAQGIIASHARGRQDAHALEALESALEEVEGLGKMGCRICWMFNGIEEARHTWGDCSSTAETKDLSFRSCMDFQGQIDYKKDRQARFLSCFYCHVSQELCRDGYKTKGASCWRWKHTVIPVALAATTEADLLLRIQEAAGREFKSRQDYGDWLGRKHRSSY
ncbi:recq family [Fusarium longipes]|uniref:DNA 3'-5' helicase n=1 Tax=Fusarium longipes TaxID=694270 RepID=A0A395RI43_9HYPO|nr:recq family [Fusarium longipes]